MATVTVPIIAFDGFVTVAVQYDDTTVTGTADTFDAALIRAVVTNESGGNVRLELVRGNGAPWQSAVVGPGVTNFNSGGPVRRLSDLARWSLTVEQA